MFRHLTNEGTLHLTERLLLFFVSGNKIKSPVMNIQTQRTWQNGSGRQFLGGEGGGTV